MSKSHIERIRCSKCEKEIEYVYWDSVNVSLNPELKDKVLDKSIFAYKCECGYQELLPHPLLYHDMGKKIMIQYVDFDEVPETIDFLTESKNKASTLLSEIIDCDFRIVTKFEDMMEKIYILEAGYSDKVIEIIKCIYRRGFKETEAYTKSFELVFHPPIRDSEQEAERDYHLRLTNYEKGFYQIIPIDKSKFEKYENWIKFQESRRNCYDYVIDADWANCILDGSVPEVDGFYEIIDEGKRNFKEKYQNKYTELKSTIKNINELDDDEKSLLFYAVISEDYAEVKTLLENGADPNVVLDSDRTVVHYALQNGVNINIIDLLKQYGADFNKVSRKLLPLDFVDARLPVEYLMHLFNLGATYDGNRLLGNYVAHAKNVDCIKFLLDKEKRDINDSNVSCEAIFNNPYNHFLEEFLKIGGNPNSKYNGRPCFFTDIEEYNIERRIRGFYIQRLKILFSNGADINLTDSSLRTPMMFACKHCVRKEMIYFLLRYHPDLSLEDADGKDVYDYLDENENLSEREKESIRGDFILYENAYES